MGVQKELERGKMKKACFLFALVASVACKVLPPWERPGMTAEIADNTAKIEDLVFILSSPGKPDILIPINDVVDSKDWTTSTTEELTTTLDDPDWTMPVEPTTSTVSTTTDGEHFPESTWRPGCFPTRTPDCIMQEEMEFDDKTTMVSATTIEFSTSTAFRKTTTTAATSNDFSLLDTIRNVGSSAWNSFTDLGTSLWNLIGLNKIFESYYSHVNSNIVRGYLLSDVYSLYP